VKIKWSGAFSRKENLNPMEGSIEFSQYRFAESG